MIASLLLGTALVSAHKAELSISNLRSGLACTRSSPVTGRSGWICQPTELILITDQGTCVYDKQEELCTWHGFEFDYTASEPGTKLQCVSQSNRPMDNGNPEEVLARKVATTRYELELPETSGHFYNPQYYLFNLQRDGRGDPVEETVCSHNGVVAFRVKFRFHFPQAPAAQPKS